MKTKTKGISLKDISKKKLGIYVRLNKDFQRKFFSKQNTGMLIVKLAEKMNIDKRRLYQWRIENLAFPLYYGFIITKKFSKIYSYKDFCENIKEIKYGQRSKPLLINKNTFPLKMDPYYWNILFSLFCDGSSDMWSTQRGIKVVRPCYTSYKKEVMDNFIDLAKNKFAKWNFKIYSGNIRIPPIIDKIFKETHDINSFNTKSSKIETFKLNKNFENEIRKLNKDNKIAILIRFLVDEGDKSEKSLNQRCPNITITTTSKELLNILKTILDDLKIKYHVFLRKWNNQKWKNSYTLQIKRGKSRENYKKLRDHMESLKEKYSLCRLTNTQTKQLNLSIDYEYKKPRPDLSHTKIPEFIIVTHIKNKRQTSIDGIITELRKNNLDLNMNSVFSLLKGMPIKKKKKVIFYNHELENYIPYNEKQIEDAKKYDQALKLYRNGKTIAETSRTIDKPWSTVRDWVYKKSKPGPLLGPWKDLLRLEKAI